MLIYSGTSCCVKMILQKTSLKVFNELTVVNGGRRGRRSQDVLACLCLSVRISFHTVCACIDVCFDIQYLETLSRRHLNHYFIVSGETNKQQESAHSDGMQVNNVRPFVFVA